MKWTTYVWVLNGFSPEWMTSGDFAMSKRGKKEKVKKKKEKKCVVRLMPKQRKKEKAKAA